MKKLKRDTKLKIAFSMPIVIICIGFMGGLIVNDPDIIFGVDVVAMMLGILLTIWFL